MGEFGSFPRRQLACSRQMLALALTAAAPVLAQAPVDLGQIRPPVSRQFALAPRQVQQFQVKAGAGQFLRILIEKKGIDLRLSIQDPGGREIASSNNPTGSYGFECVALVTGQSGPYTVKVAANSELTLRGRYRISFDRLRAPAEDDRLELQAIALLQEGLKQDRAAEEAGLKSAIGNYTKAAALFDQLRRLYFAGLALHRVGLVYDNPRDAARALEFYNQALSIRRQARDRSGEASTLNNIGLVYLAQGDKAHALDFLGQGLRIRRDLHDRAAEAASLSNIGRAAGGASGLEDYRQALQIFQAIGDRRSEARILRTSGDALYEIGEKIQAIDSYEKALAVYRALDDHRGEAMMLNYIATTSSESGDWRKALDYHGQSLPIFHTLGDRANESATLDSIATIYNQFSSDKSKALDYYRQALEMRRADGDRQGESDTLNNIGTVYSSLGETAKALANLQPALALRRALQDRAGEAQTLGNIGSVYSFLGDKRKALEFYGQALSIQQTLGNRASEAKILNNIAATDSELGEQQQALDAFKQALEIERSLGDRLGEASTLCNMGGLYSILGETQQALDLCNQAYGIDQAIGARSQAAHTLNVLGRIHSDQGDYREALELYSRALAIHRAIGDRAEEAATLHNLGRTYFMLGERAEALNRYQQSLAIFHEVGDRWNEARMLGNLGSLYADQKDTAKALECYGQARAVFQAAGDQAGEAGALDSLGQIYDALGDPQKAIEFYNQALPVWRAVGDRAGEAGTLNNSGAVYDAQGQKLKALQCYQQALEILRAAGDRAGEAKALSNLSVLFAEAHPDLAIFFGKQAVNVLQSVRRSNADLEDSERRNYEASIASYYRNLAALLVGRQRFAEAEEILGLLKDKETGIFLQRDSVAGELRSATLLGPEKAALFRYEQLVGQVIAIGQKKAALIAKSESTALSDEERAQSDRLDSDLGAANLVLQRFFDEEEKTLASDSGTARRVAELREAEGVQGSLAELGPDVVAIYTLVTPDKYIAMLVTAGARKAYTTPIKQADLNAKIFQFRQQLQNPASDPLPLARELYQVVFPEGLRQDLDSIQARTIMWSMDGPLRYIPMAALHDGREYLVMRFRNSLITPASMENLKEAPQPHWQGVGFGVSEAKAGFSALPSVPAELHSIFHQTGGGTAPLEGSVRLDAEFTRDAFLNDLRQPNHRVVHIATHFDSRPLAANSVLLLGDGHPWSLQEIRSVPRLFHGVDLLTLSACSTAFTNRSEDGREVDSFGTIAQQLGARSVIASLWSVSDEATAVLMRTMYRLREENPAIGKSEALREAQAGIASGTLRPDVEAASQDRGVAPAHAAPSPQARNWSHPYYWAPFILIGNWK